MRQRPFAEMGSELERQRNVRPCRASTQNRQNIDSLVLYTASPKGWY